ncbi:DUF2589 domain-containing protein [Myroides sp. WP-1]|uniref:DUF2589 domain-containing protein n=1 Tax=Myroides sp. WP-1 TaxID=2759944 RepID=UPI0021070F35|nr:DUF2589 domain-containing protein [Myroides sp. WP-1]
MNQNNNLPKYSREQESELNIESIISAPLIALSKANSMMLNGQALSILNQYFIKTKKKKKDYSTSVQTIYRPKMINMILTSNRKIDGEITSQEVIFQIPLISLVPLNTIALQKMRVIFNLDITSTTSYINNTNDIIERKAQLNGKISNNSSENPMQENYTKASQRALKIDLKAGSLPLPLGILNILEVYSKNLQPLKMK